MSTGRDHSAAGGTSWRTQFPGAQAGRAPATSSLPKKVADKDDCADMVVAMCRTETMTGQTVVIDSGRIFH